MLQRYLASTLLLAGLAAFGAGRAEAQGADTRIKDLAAVEGALPVRLMGYGIVVGLNGTGDRSLGSGAGSPHTVRAVANALRRLGVNVPEEQLRMRNVAAVMVTAEAPAYSRSGARFDVRVSSIGDARSLDGGVLLMTPLLSDVGQDPIAVAQGVLQVQQGDGRIGYQRGAGSATVPSGAVLEASLAAPANQDGFVLALKRPDATTALRIAEAINRTFGQGSATLRDPGAVAVTPPAGGAGPYAFLAQLEALEVESDALAEVVVNAATGSVVAGGQVRLGSAMVSHAGFTLAIGGEAGEAAAEEAALGALRAPVGTLVQDVAAALQAAGARPQDISHIFQALQSAGALNAHLRVQ